MPRKIPRKNILRLLTGGNRRTIGQADQVVAIVSDDRELFPHLIAGLWSGDPLVRMRAADAAEKISRKHFDWLQPHKNELLGLMTTAKQQELRWHLAVLVPRLTLSPKEHQTAVATLQDYLEDGSSIVKTFALQGLADLAQKDPAFRPSVVEILREAGRKGTPAMKARSRRLLLRLEPN